MVEQGLAGGQQAHALGDALEEGRAQLVFQREDVTAERRLGDVQPARGPAHVALFRHRDEGLEVRDAHGPGV